MSFLEPTAIIWLAQSLESLYDVPAALSFNFLSSRILKFLDGPPAMQKRIRKRLRELYDTRNSFAHGGAPVIHPIGNEVLDPTIESYRAQWIEQSTFGATLILATIQKHILNQWSEIRYDEQYYGVPIIKKPHVNRHIALTE
jgi:hypothetical protein